jgi:L-threonylcarbamoyladenylate synthase
VAALADRDEVVAVLARTAPKPEEFDGTWIEAPRDVARYAHDLYANLRDLDSANADAILIEDVPQAVEWMAVRDRLLRATQGLDDDRD